MAALQQLRTTAFPGLPPRPELPVSSRSVCPIVQQQCGHGWQAQSARVASLALIPQRKRAPQGTQPPHSPWRHGNWFVQDIFFSTLSCILLTYFYCCLNDYRWMRAHGHSLPPSSSLVFPNYKESKAPSKGVTHWGNARMRKHQRTMVSAKQIHVHCFYNAAKNKVFIDWRINNS